MENYKISFYGINGNFDLIDPDGQVVCEMRKKSLWSNIMIGQFNGEEYKMKPKNLWNTKFHFFKDDVVIAKLSMGWTGSMSIKLYDEHKLIFKRKGVWNPRFELTNEIGETILSMYSTFKWGKLNFDYDIELNFSAGRDVLHEELLLFCGYGIKRFKMRQAGAA